MANDNGKDPVDRAFLLAHKTLKADRNGKMVLSVSLADRAGAVDGRLFDRAAESAAAVDEGDVVWAKGFVQTYQGRRQVVLRELRRAGPGEYEFADLVADPGVDPRAHLAALEAVLPTIQNQFIRAILAGTLSDPVVRAALLKAPAAKTIHHAYRGGLLEHVRAIVGLMDFLSGHYPWLDRDLLVFGAIFHDLGKIHELEIAEGVQYTTPGRLVGHIVMASEMVDRFARATPGFPPELADVLKHVILSHHGKLEYGSPKLPMLAEAVAVAMVDELDSRLDTIASFLRAEVAGAPADAKWSRYHPALGRCFYLDFFRAKLKPPEGDRPREDP